MWICKRCGNEFEDNLEICWGCQANRHETVDGPPTSTPDGAGFEQHSGEQRPRRTTLGAQLQSRYQEAYRVARATITAGKTVKVIGVILAVLSVIVTIVLGARAMSLIVPTLLIGTTYSILVYVLGVLISAYGQILLTGIDTAINTSSFLDDESRAVIMRLDLIGLGRANAGGVSAEGDNNISTANVFDAIQVYAEDKQTSCSLQQKLNVVRINESTGRPAFLINFRKGTMIRLYGEIGEGAERKIVLTAAGTFFLADHAELGRALGLN